jgi:hypothetical protein
MNIRLIAFEQKLSIIDRLITGDYLLEQQDFKELLLLEEQSNILLHENSKQSALDSHCDSRATVLNEVGFHISSNEFKSDYLAESRRYLINFNSWQNHYLHKDYIFRLINRLINDYLELGGTTQPIFKQFKQFKQESCRRIKKQKFLRLTVCK